MKRFDLASLRAAFWTWRSARYATRAVKRRALDPIALPRVPSIPPSASRGVVAVLRRRSDTCLVRAVVRQAWLKAHGDRRELIIGVKPPSKGFEAHAWLAGDDPCHNEGFTELLRRPA